MSVASDIILRRILAFDASTCLGLGVALAAAAPILTGPTGLPPGLLRGAGLALLPIGLFIAAVGRYRPLPPLVWLIVAGNLGWAAASLALLGSGWVQPTPLGAAFVAAQALAVAGLAAVEGWLVRRAAPGFGAA